MSSGQPEASSAAAARKGTVLIVEDDPTIGKVVAALLGDEGYAVSILGDATSASIRDAVGRLEPDCILLDSTSGAGVPSYEPTWLDAVWAHTRRRPVPVLMFTAEPEAIGEATVRESERSQAIYAVVTKPFDIDVLLDTVARAVGSVPRFDHSEAAELRRTAALVAHLEAAGAGDVRTSTRREWANFYAHGALTIIYWSQRDGVYFVLRQPEESGAVREVGRFHDLDHAVARAMEPPGSPAPRSPHA